MTHYYSTITTPTGPFSIAVNDVGAVTATAFGGKQRLLSRIKEGHLKHAPDRTKQVSRQIEEYFAGSRRTFDLQLAPQGTSFQHSVWAALQRIPWGKTATYGDIAAKLKRPKAARAVGRANGTNPICLIVPCHRVIGADGSLTGFAFGEKIKEELLIHEGVLTPTLV